MSNKHSVDQIKAWALENYEKCYGASCLIECFTDEELTKEFKTLDDAKDFATMMSEQLLNTEAHLHREF